MARSPRTSLNFGAEIDEWVKKTEARMLAVFRDAGQEVFSIAQTTRNQGGKLPIKTGFLRNSFISSLNGSTVVSGPTAYALSFDAASLGDVVFGGWTAEYARRMEFGFIGTDSLGRNYNQSGFGFVANAAAQWQSIVNRHAARLKALSS